MGDAMKNKNSYKNRTNSGATLVSLLVATIIFSFVAMGLMGMMSLNTFECNRTFNRADTLNSGRIALDKIGIMVRSARSFGDIQGTTMIATDPWWKVSVGPNTGYQATPNNVNMNNVTSGANPSISSKFPSPCDMFYNATMPSDPATLAPLPNGTAWPWNANGPYQLGPDTLILQVQTFNADGFPLAVPQSTFAALGLTQTTRMPALDTYVFKVVPDPNLPGPTKWFQLQMAIFPAGRTTAGSANLTNMPTGMTAGVPITLCSGIVGPVDAAGKPAMFQYVNTQLTPSTLTTDFSSNPAGLLNETNLLAYFRGVVVNLQLMKVDAAGKAMVNTVRSEYYLRNNASAAVMGNSN